MKNLKWLSLALLFTFRLFSYNAFAQKQDKELLKGSFAPSFKIKDIEGNFHTIEQYKGHKILLSFYRNAGCPVCNLRFHQLEENRAYFEQKGIILLSVYESSPENLSAYVDTNHYYQKMIANPSSDLYDLYGVEISKAKVTKGLFKGALKKAKKGKKLYSSKIKQDGNKYRITADFLINEDGNIIEGYYGQYLGDRLPIEWIKEKIGS